MISNHWSSTRGGHHVGLLRTGRDAEESRPDWWMPSFTATSFGILLTTLAGSGRRRPARKRHGHRLSSTRCRAAPSWRWWTKSMATARLVGDPSPRPRDQRNRGLLSFSSDRVAGDERIDDDHVDAVCRELGDDVLDQHLVDGPRPSLSTALRSVSELSHRNRRKQAGAGEFGRADARSACRRRRCAVAARRKDPRG